MLSLPISKVLELPRSEINLWSAYLIRKRGVPLGDEKAMKELTEKVRIEEEKREHQRILDSMTWM